MSSNYVSRQLDEHGFTAPSTDPAVEIDGAQLLEEALLSVITNSIDELRFDCESNDLTPIVDDVDTFEDLGVMTSNRGLVIRTTDGHEYQLTIVRSR